MKNCTLLCFDFAMYTKAKSSIPYMTMSYEELNLLLLYTLHSQNTIKFNSSYDQVIHFGVYTVSLKYRADFLTIPEICEFWLKT